MKVIKFFIFYLLLIIQSVHAEDNAPDMIKYYFWEWNSTSILPGTDEQIKRNADIETVIKGRADIIGFMNILKSLENCHKDDCSNLENPKSRLLIELYFGGEVVKYYSNGWYLYNERLKCLGVVSKDFRREIHFKECDPFFDEGCGPTSLHK